ncbi:low molecular weight phosphotyrosine protein phosphatase [Cereibacter changlensis]|uniref:protein-tyrosine-phosphatase n=1 Tax=Cereibacter changlensis TaxID=402884 RepID=A0A4V5NMB9_9RHOB|nr:low molecular weight phosphotyrosine protein phosphatase [Cereibacter changlensis]TKA98127.1 low molecular weight phosphotyrosine protein phosphatase [Cereibacter changlensis]
MFNSVLVVCVGNICRSPVGERLLAAELEGITVGSAGLGALVGHPADPLASEVAAERGLSLEGHKGRQFTAELGREYDLILAMEPRHRAEIIRMAPQLSGKTMLFDQWTGARGIEDPFRRPRELHRQVQDQIARAAEAWVQKLKPKTP